MMGQDAEINHLKETMSHLSIQICQLEELFNSRQKELRESHVLECGWYNSRCRHKNDLIQILARRIAHLSATDRHGLFLETILTEIRQLERDESYPTNIYQLQMPNIPTDPHKPLNFNELDFNYETLCLFLNYERKRLMVILKNTKTVTIKKNNSTLIFKIKWLMFLLFTQNFNFLIINKN